MTAIEKRKRDELRRKRFEAKDPVFEAQRIQADEDILVRLELQRQYKNGPVFQLDRKSDF